MLSSPVSCLLHSALVYIWAFSAFLSEWRSGDIYASTPLTQLIGTLVLLVEDRHREWLLF